MAKIAVHFPTWTNVEWVCDNMFAVETLDGVIHLICLEGQPHDNRTPDGPGPQDCT